MSFTALLAAPGLGALLGWAGGVMNRFFDLRLKDKELALQESQQAHELLRMDKEREFMIAEAGQKLQVVQEEGAQRLIDVTYKAMTESYGNDKATYGGGRVDALRGLIRPMATALYGFASLFMVAVILYYGFFVYRLAFSTDQMHVLLSQSVQWVFFMTEVCVGWWFGSRPAPALRPPGMKV